MIKTHTAVVQDYLKAVHQVQGEEGTVTTTALARYLGVTPASVTGMVKKLAGLHLLTYARYRGVTLTPKGRQLALRVLRHHRLVELYLVRHLRVPWDKVHLEAERWEHVISDDIEHRLDTLLGRPTADPHGAPIPTRRGNLPQTPRVRLSELKTGERGVIVEVSDRDAELLRYLGRMGVFPGVRVQLLAVEPFGGPLALRVGNARGQLPRQAAEHVFIRVKPGRSRRARSDRSGSAGIE